MDRADALRQRLDALPPPGEGQPELNAWAHQFRKEQSAITSEARAVLRGAHPNRLEAMVKKSQYWPAMTATCDIAKQVIEWVKTLENTNNKAAHQERPCLALNEDTSTARSTSQDYQPAKADTSTTESTQ